MVAFEEAVERLQPGGYLPNPLFAEIDGPAVVGAAGREPVPRLLALFCS